MTDPSIATVPEAAPQTLAETPTETTPAKLSRSAVVFRTGIGALLLILLANFIKNFTNNESVANIFGGEIDTILQTKGANSFRLLQRQYGFRRLGSIFTTKWSFGADYLSQEEDFKVTSVSRRDEGTIFEVAIKIPPEVKKELRERNFLKFIPSPDPNAVFIELFTKDARLKESDITLQSVIHGISQAIKGEHKTVTLSR